MEKVTDVHNLRKYKESLVVVAHLGAILRVFDLTERSLVHFKDYIAVSKVLKVINEQKSILQVAYDEYNCVKKSKGKRPNE